MAQNKVSNVVCFQFELQVASEFLKLDKDGNYFETELSSKSGHRIKVS